MPTISSLKDAFKKEEFKGLVIDTYIANQPSVYRHLAEKVYTIGYKKIKHDGKLTNKFATLSVIRGLPTLILHIGQKEDKHGITLQSQIDDLLGKKYSRNENQVTEKVHEVFIRLDWVDKLETITPYIDQAYNERE